MKMLGLKNSCELISKFEMTFWLPTCLLFVLINATKEWQNFAYFSAVIELRTALYCYWRMTISNPTCSVKVWGDCTNVQSLVLWLTPLGFWLTTESCPAAGFPPWRGKGGRRKLDRKGVSTGEGGQGGLFLKFRPKVQFSTHHSLLFFFLYDAYVYPYFCTSTELEWV